ncbi:sporulation repeat-containing protein [Caballeronia hypogeia]|uniref:Sporulation repeat-containing protein n=1 Tax=Caballeronia hypogeia TaxID=1777140 RepID=A0A158D7H7_9BURK|nr:SPOR domain-containing protein [Caballeronia hypogeia]SAK89737.1 sporulation repeat-containing protein [Caballeronia hypogeia]
MGLFSFGKKDDSGRDAYSDSSRGARHTVRTERRTRRSERTDADAMMLDPTLPEKQRARRRLVGAIALVLAAVIVLPMVLDSRPKPVTDDISIDIPNRPAPAATAKQSRDAADADSQAGVAHDNAPAAGASGSVAAGVTQPQAAAASAATAQAKPEPKDQAKTEAKTDAKPSKPAAVASNNAKPQAAEDANTNAAAGAANTPSSPAGSRFVLQIGQFDEETAAQNWVNKLKAAGVPAYLEHRKQSDGSTKSLLRAGPFPDRASAQAALAKVKLAGLGGGARPTN